jgi:hypothetical protein
MPRSRRRRRREHPMPIAQPPNDVLGATTFDLYSFAVGLALAFLMAVVPMTPLLRGTCWVALVGCLLFPVWHWQSGSPVTRVLATLVVVIVASVAAWETWPTAIAVWPEGPFEVNTGTEARWTYLTVSNQTDSPQYSVWVAIYLRSSNESPDTLKAITIKDAADPPPCEDCDLKGHDVSLSGKGTYRRRPARFALIREVMPHQARHISVHGSMTTKAEACAEVVSYQSVPVAVGSEKIRWAPLDESAHWSDWLYYHVLRRSC